MRLALAGRGRMGREVERVARERGHEIACVVGAPGGAPGGAAENAGASAGNSSGSALSAAALAGVDVVVDFSTAAAVLANAEAALAAGARLVVGTTGWLARLPELQALVERYDGGAVYAANFSLGAQIYFRVVDEAARLLGKLEAYDPLVMEWHHRQKSDAPSGTAAELAAIVRRHDPRKTSTLAASPAGRIDPAALHVVAARAGWCPGRHTVTWDSEGDTIELTHTARSRAEFARGAVVAAEWINGRRGLYTAADLVEDLSR